jgi:putative membrane protein
MIGKSLFGAVCAAVIMAASSLSPVHAATPPREFLQNAIRGDNSEIMLGRMAARRADSPSVREFGRVLVKDHSQARDQASALARRMGMTVPTMPTRVALRERVRLAPLSGELFDREFTRYMIRDHRQDVSEFRQQIAMNNGPVSRMARMQLPVIQKHLGMAVGLYREPRVAEAQTR